MSQALEELMSSDSLAISRSQAAAAAGVDPRTINKGVQDGTIPSIRLGSRVLIPRQKFLALFTDEPAGKK